MIKHKNIRISGPKLRKSILLDIGYDCVGVKWYNVWQHDLNYEKTFIYYNINEVFKLVRKDLYNKIVKMKESYYG